jgi:hypothetical protein
MIDSPFKEESFFARVATSLKRINISPAIKRRQVSFGGVVGVLQVEQDKS